MNNRFQNIIILCTIAFAVFFSAADNLVVSSALPSLISKLAKTEFQSWSISAYVLCSTLSMPVFGLLADKLGVKKMFLTGVSCFLLGSLFCSISSNFLVFGLSRALQGIGGGIVNSLSFAALAKLFDSKKTVQTQTLLGLVIGIATIAGPSLGFYLTKFYGWQSIFLINIPIYILVFIVIILFFPKDLISNNQPHEINVFSIIYISLCLGGLIVLLTFYDSMIKRESILLLISVVIFSIALFISETRSQCSLIPFKSFKSNRFVFVILISIFNGFITFSSLIYFPILFQLSYGISQEISSRWITYLVGSMIVSALFSTLSISKGCSIKQISIIGSSLSFAGFLIMMIENGNSQSIILQCSNVLIGAGLGCILSILPISAKTLTSNDSIATGTSFVMFARNIGGAIGLALIGMVVYNILIPSSTDLISSAAANIFTADHDKAMVIKTIANKLILQSEHNQNFLELHEIQKVGLKALNAILSLFSIIAGASLLFSIYLPKAMNLTTRKKGVHFDR